MASSRQRARALAGSMARSVRARGGWVACVLILWLAFALRVYRLGAKNLWWDEALAIWAVRQGLAGATLWTAGDVHPPLYFWSLWGWVQAVGESEFAARFLSVGWGLLAIPLVYRLSCRLFNRSIALLASLFLATARFPIWWSQELRMYIVATGCVLFSLECFTRLYIGEARWRVWLGYVLSTTAALYSLYLAGLVLAIENAFLVLTARGRSHPRDFWTDWLASQAAVLVLFVPWLGLALGRMHSWSASNPFDVRLFLQLYGLVLSTGISTYVTHYQPLLVGFAVVALGGLAAVWRQREKGHGWQGWERGLLLALCLVLPVLAVYLLTLPRAWFYVPRVEARYLVVFAAAYYLLLAAAAGLLYRRSSWAGALLGLAVLVAFGWALRGYYADRYLRDEYQSAVQTISAYAHPDDAVLLISGNRYPLFRYYYERQIPVARRPRLYELPRYASEMTPQNVGEELERATGHHPRVWLVLAEAHLQDPRGLAEPWMEDHYTRTLGYVWDSNRLALYVPVPVPAEVGPENLAPQYPLEGVAGGNPLSGADLPTSEFRAWDVIHLGLYWQEITTTEVRITLVDARGQAVEDQLLAGAGDDLLQRRPVDFLILPFTPPGTYHFHLRAPEGTWEFGRLAVQGTRHLPSVGRPDHPLEASLGGVVRLQGYDVLPEGPVRPGGTLAFDLYWEATGAMDEDYTVFVHLLGPFNPATGGPVWAQHDGQPLEGQYPTRYWRPGLVLKDRHSLALPPELPEGEYQMEVGLYLLSTGERLPVLGPDGTPDTRVLWGPVQVIR